MSAVLHRDPDISPASSRAGHMHRILYLVPFYTLVPFYYQLSRYLGSRGCEASFVAFLLREHVWLRKNGLQPVPADVYSVTSYRIKDGLLSPQEVDEVLRFTVSKAGGDLELWKDRLRRMASWLDDLLDAHPFDAVLIWNGQEISGKTLALLAARRGIRTVFAENGYFPNTLQFDLQGVNVDSSITRLPFPEIRRSGGQSPARMPPAGTFDLGQVRALTWTDLLRCFLARKLDLSHYRHFPEHLGNSWFSEQWLKVRKALIPPDQAPLPDKFIFIAFQVHDDTQILLNSRFVKSMEQFFEASYAAIKRTFGDEYAIVVKEHPEDLCRHSYGRLRARYPDVVWLRKYSIDTLLDRAAFVFVVNSSVGLQALQRGKPTIVFGDSFYSREEIVFRVDRPERADEVLQQARSGMTAERQEDIDCFIRFLNERYFVAAGWKNVTAAGVVRAGDRILELIR